jgi:hypothetical protein
MHRARFASVGGMSRLAAFLQSVRCTGSSDNPDTHRDQVKGPTTHAAPAPPRSPAGPSAAMHNSTIRLTDQVAPSSKLATPQAAADGARGWGVQHSRAWVKPLNRKKKMKRQKKSTNAKHASAGTRHMANRDNSRSTQVTRSWPAASEASSSSKIAWDAGGGSGAASDRKFSPAAPARGIPPGRDEHGQRSEHRDREPTRTGTVGHSTQQQPPPTPAADRRSPGEASPTPTAAPSDPRALLALLAAALDRRDAARPPSPPPPTAAGPDLGELIAAVRRMTESDRSCGEGLITVASEVARARDTALALRTWVQGCAELATLDDGAIADSARHALRVTVLAPLRSTMKPRATKPAERE